MLRVLLDHDAEHLLGLAEALGLLEHGAQLERDGRHRGKLPARRFEHRDRVGLAGVLTVVVGQRKVRADIVRIALEHRAKHLFARLDVAVPRQQARLDHLDRQVARVGHAGSAQNLRRVLIAVRVDIRLRQADQEPHVGRHQRDRPLVHLDRAFAVPQLFVGDAEPVE